MKQTKYKLELVNQYKQQDKATITYTIAMVLAFFFALLGVLTTPLTGIIGLAGALFFFAVAVLYFYKREKSRETARQIYSDLLYEGIDAKSQKTKKNKLY